VSRFSRRPSEHTPLWRARQWLDEKMHEKGALCPCCGQFAKYYHRSFPAATARAMIEMYRYDEGRDWLYMPPILDVCSPTARRGGEGVMGHHWGLQEHQPGIRDDGSRKNGHWRLSDEGREFVRLNLKVPRYATVFNNQCVGLDGPAWSIRDALGTRFNYRDLMDGL